MAVLEIGKSERKVVWEREDNELRFRDVEFGESVGRLDGVIGRYLKCASEVSRFSVPAWNISQR